MSFYFKKPLRIIAATVCVIVVTAYLYAENIHGFLSPYAPIKAQILVIEGWLPDYAFKKAAEHLSSNDYALVIVTGGPIEQGSFLSEYKTYAQLGRETLIKILNRKDIIAVPSPSARKDRTYASAIGLKRWLDQNHHDFNSINLISLDAHSRRSWYLYKKVLDEHYSVGIMAVNVYDNNRNRWWACSEGFKTVIDETIAYVYTLLFFPHANDLAG